MKKLGLFMLGLCFSFVGANAFAQCGTGSCGAQAPVDNNCGIQPGVEYQGSGNCICYCPVTKYSCQYYYTSRCEQEPYEVTKQCNRKVPQYYTVKRCRMVPEYYETTHCRYVDEPYCVTETRYKNKVCYDKHVRYIPCTYYKKVCAPNPVCGQAAPVAPVAPSCGCN